ncbi:hypothetical protein SBA5_110086 [Candidatus Sulfotelmatomonas gaucii]|uniref:Uncharacterized protein n=1 Tax=Candidatus Sulfuritelmatomonas gaucii TaxID=2043161 RepID=A0A2N9L318_9BACT|nr:hypothetical protein SBA5_110086 [Candidatus Sulfotelmatomonas gaucii]
MRCGRSQAAEHESRPNDRIPVHRFLESRHKQAMTPVYAIAGDSISAAPTQLSGQGSLPYGRPPLDKRAG